MRNRKRAACKTFSQAHGNCYDEIFVSRKSRKISRVVYLMIWFFAANFFWFLLLALKTARQFQISGIDRLYGYRFNWFFSIVLSLLLFFMLQEFGKVGADVQNFYSYQYYQNLREKIVFDLAFFREPVFLTLFHFSTKYWGPDGFYKLLHFFWAVLFFFLLVNFSFEKVLLFLKDDPY